MVSIVFFSRAVSACLSCYINKPSVTSFNIWIESDLVWKVTIYSESLTTAWLFFVVYIIQNINWPRCLVWVASFVSRAGCAHSPGRSAHTRNSALYDVIQGHSRKKKKRSETYTKPEGVYLTEIRVIV